jgi:hypothetical protein
LWQTVVLLVCSIIQVIGVLVEGIAKILFAFAKILERAHDRALDWKTIEKKKEVHIDIPL